jgi:tetratricopeptide (TPR) repeat protein
MHAGPILPRVLLERTDGRILLRVMERPKVLSGGRPSPNGERRCLAEDARAAMRFVGRTGELSELAGVVGEMLAGRPRVRLIVGEAGIGKTRVAEEIARLAAKEGAQALWGRSHDDAGEPPFWPWAQAVRVYAAQRSDADLYADIVGAPEVAEIAPVIRERLPDLPAVDAPSSEQARFARFASFAAFLAAAAERNPILLILDDLHWADDASLRLLRFVAREPMPARLMVLATLREAEARRRPEIQSSLADLARLAPRVILGGLGVEEVVQLAEASLGRRVEHDVGRRVRELSGGNPFFVTEILRAYSGRDRASSPALTDLTLPAGVRATVQRRIELLTPETRRLLEAAAVVGEEFDLEIVRAAGRIGHARAIELLDEARADSLVVERSESSQFEFVHALVREVLYRELPVARRGQLHLAVAQAIERTRSADLDAHVASLVRHYESAAVSGTAAARAAERAVDCAMRAADQARSRCAFEDAAAYLARALSVLGDRAGRAETRAEILVRLGEVRACGGDKAAAREAFSVAADLARRSALWGHLARAALGFAGTWVRLVVREDPAVSALLEEALVGAPRHAALGLCSRLQARLAMELAAPAMAERRLALADRAVATARRSRDDDALAFALTVRHLLSDDSGELNRRLATAREVVEIARRVRSDELAADGVGLLVRDYLEGGRIREMEEALLEQGRLAERLRQPQALWHVALRRVMRALLCGRLAEAEALADEAEKLGERAQVANPVFVLGLQRAMIRREQGRLAAFEPVLQEMAAATRDLPLTTFWIAWLHASLGRRDQAAEELGRVATDRFADAPSGVERLLALTLAAETCRFLGDRQHAATLRELLLPHAGRNVIVANALAYVDCVSRPLGLLAATLGDAAEAEEHLEAALATYRRLGALARRAHAQADLAEVLLARGGGPRRRRALDLLADAARSAREIGMLELHRRAVERATAAQDGATPLRDGSQARLPSHVFRLEGEYWSVAFPGGPITRFRDARGMRQIAFLLARPGEDVPAVDLAAAGDRHEGRLSSAASAVRLDAPARSHLGDAGEVLDLRSRGLYRQRIRDLREQIEEARSQNDTLRVSSAEREIGALAAELASGFGLRGTSRRVASHVERARVSTTRTVRDAIRRISEKHPQLGYHLARTVKTGRLCSYDPPPGARIVWQLD